MNTSHSSQDFLASGLRTVRVEGAAVQRLQQAINADFVRAFSDTAVKERLLGQGAEVAPGTPEQFGAFVKSDMAKWAAGIKRAGIKPD